MIAWSTRIPRSLSTTRSMLKWRGHTIACKWVQEPLLPFDTAKVDDMKSEYFSEQLQASFHPWRHVHVLHPRNGVTVVRHSHERPPIVRCISMSDAWSVHQVKRM